MMIPTSDSTVCSVLQRPDETPSTETLQAAIAEAWQALQATPSYLDSQIAANRGLLESIASQRSDNQTCLCPC
jgi:hypothetical protein